MLHVTQPARSCGRQAGLGVPDGVYSQLGDSFRQVSTCPHPHPWARGADAPWVLPALRSRLLAHRAGQCLLGGAAGLGLRCLPAHVTHGTAAAHSGYLLARRLSQQLLGKPEPVGSELLLLHAG